MTFEPEQIAAGPDLADDEDVTHPGAGAPVDPYIGREIENRYQILRKLGEGGMGRVYLGTHLRTGAALAIKMVDAPHPAHSREIQARFLKEARAMMEVRSNHVAHSLDVGALPGGELYLAMEYLEGEDLQALLRREGPLPWPRLAAIALQICSGLGSAHRHGIIHRDIKPSNLFRITLDDNHDHIKIIDFGIARDIDEATGPTQKGAVVGTTEYLAPEIVTGDARASVRSDIYALGATMYKLLTGLAVFRGETPLEIMGKHVHADRVPPSRAAPHLGIPASVDAILLRALAKDPLERFASAEELAQAMRADLELLRSGGARGPSPHASGPALQSPGLAVGEPEIAAWNMVLQALNLRVAALLTTIAVFVVATKMVMLTDAAAPTAPLRPALAPATASVLPTVPPEPASSSLPMVPTTPTQDPGLPDPQRPAPADPAPPAKPRPEPAFPYDSARNEIAQQLPYLRTTCLATNPVTTQVKFRVYVAPAGAPSIRVFSANKDLRACVRKALTFRFDRSPRGGAFVYTLTSSSANFVPAPLAREEAPQP